MQRFCLSSTFFSSISPSLSSRPRAPSFFQQLRARSSKRPRPTRRSRKQPSCSTRYVQRGLKELFGRSSWKKKAKPRIRASVRGARPARTTLRRAALFSYLFSQPRPLKKQKTLGHGRARRRERGLESARRRAQPKGRCGKRPRVWRSRQGRDVVSTRRAALDGPRRRGRSTDAQAQGAPHPGRRRESAARRDRHED